MRAFPAKFEYFLARMMIPTGCEIRYVFDDDHVLPREIQAQILDYEYRSRSRPEMSERVSEIFRGAHLFDFMWARLLDETFHRELQEAYNANAMIEFFISDVCCRFMPAEVYFVARFNPMPMTSITYQRNPPKGVRSLDLHDRLGLFFSAMYHKINSVIGVMKWFLHDKRVLH